MRVYREFIVDENTRAVEVRWIDESTGREMTGHGHNPRSRSQSQRLDWAWLARPATELQLIGSH